MCRLVNKTLPFNGFAHRENRTFGDGLQDYCILTRAQATLLSFPEDYLHQQNAQHLNERCICIELVGSRFLRRMVRIIVVSSLCFYC
jgi:tRNA U38,U39,U40 pseudouridine synthase TruA